MASTRIPLKLQGTQAGERYVQQQIGVDRAACRLLITIASRLHERLASSVSMKLANTDTNETPRKYGHDLATGQHADISGVSNEDDTTTTSNILSSSSSVPHPPIDFDSDAGNSDILNDWKGFPRSVSYYLPLISTLACMARKNCISVLFHLMIEWLPQRHVLMSGGPVWELTAAAMSKEASNSPPSSVSPSSSSASVSSNDHLNYLNQINATNPSSPPTPTYSPFSANPLSLVLSEEESLTESLFSFTSFTSRILNLKLSDQSQLDLVELVVLQVVADVLSLVLSSQNQSSRVELKSLEKLVQISFTLARASQPRAIDEVTWKALQAPVIAQWGVVLGYLAPLLMPVFSTFMTMSFSKLPQESQLLLLERMHIPLYRADESEVVSFIMASLPHLLSTKEKSIAVRLVQLDTLDHWLMSCDMRNGGPLFDKIKDVFKQLMSMSTKSEELEGATNKLLATILAHAPASFRDKHIDSILSKSWLKLCWSSKKRDYLECILRVLRGPFVDYHQPYGTVMFPPEPSPNTLPIAVIFSPPGSSSVSSITTTISVYRPGGSLASKLGIKPHIPSQAMPGANPFDMGLYEKTFNTSLPKATPGSTSATVSPASQFAEESMFAPLSQASNQPNTSPYAQCGFAGDREDKMLQRLITINSALFGQKNPLPRLGESLEICAEIVVQIVAHHIKFGINSVLTPLARGPSYNRMIALHALKKILNPSSGFLQTSYCFQHAYNVPDDSNSEIEESSTERKTNNIAEEDLKVLQDLLTEIVTDSLVSCQRQLKEGQFTNKYEVFPLQAHAQTCYADLEFLHELGTKQQLSSATPTPLKSCFERVRQLVLVGGAQAWSFRQKEADQMHAVVQDTVSKWMTASGIPIGFQASDLMDSSDDLASTNPSSDRNTSTKQGGSTKDSATASEVMTVPLSGPHVTGATGTMPGSIQSKKWPWKKKNDTEKFTMTDVAREAIGCLDLALSSVHVLVPGEDLFIGQLLLHPDEEIAQTCSMQLQQALLTRPSLRSVILKGLCGMASNLICSNWALYAPQQPRSFTTSNGFLIAEPNNILAILSQVLLFVDLWNLVSLMKSKSKPKYSVQNSKSTDDNVPNASADFSPPPSLMDDLDALALIGLASNVPMIRSTSLALANSLDVLRDMYGLSNRGVAWIIRQVETPLLQRARYAYLSEIVQGVESKVTVKSDSMPLKIETVACSHNNAFWGHVLAELCHALTDHPSTYQSVVSSRFMVNQYCLVWRNLISMSGVAFDYRGESIHADFPTLYKFIHIILFATLSVPLYTTSGVPTTLSIFNKGTSWNSGFYPNSVNGNLPQQTNTTSPLSKNPNTSNTQKENVQQQQPFPTTSTPSFMTVDDVPIDARALRHADERLSQVISQLHGYISGMFKTFTLDDHPALVESVGFAASYVHWRSSLVVAAHAWKWYSNLSSKSGLSSKKRMKARPHISSLFRRLMRHQEQFKWSLRTPSPAWVYYVAPLADLAPPSPGRRAPGSSIPALPPIYLHIQGMGNRKPLQGMPTHEMMLAQAAQTSNIEDGPLGPLLLLLPRIFYQFIADTASAFTTLHAKSSSLEVGQYFIDNASMLSSLITAMTDNPLVCCKTGALRQYLAPTQHRNSILSVLASGTNSSLLQVAASAGGSLGTTPKTSESMGTISPSSLPATLSSQLSQSSGISGNSAYGINLSLPINLTQSVDSNFSFGTVSAASGATMASHLHERSSSISGPSSKDIPPPIHINWSDLTEMLLSWAPVGKASAYKVALDQVEVSKLLARIKNPNRREERRIFTSFFIGNVNMAALSALNRLAMCGLAVPSSVVDKREVSSKVLFDWVLDSDRYHSTRLLRWLLASHLDVLLPVYIDRALGRDRISSETSQTTSSSSSKDNSQKENVYFIHAIYDQFLEDAASAPPEDGITHITRLFFDRYFQLQKERIRYEKSVLKKEDKDFTRTVVSQAGPLLFLVLLNLSHSSALIRTRSFELLYRLGPIAFGLSHGLADYDLAKRFQDLRDAFISRMEGISRERALEVAQLVAASCKLFTEDVFVEAFLRFKNLTGSNKTWALQFLTCWADNCRFQTDNTRLPVLNNDRDSTAWKSLSTDALLHNLYGQLTTGADLTDKSYGRAPLLGMWVGLGRAGSGVNLPAIVEFLLAKSVVSKNDLATCKMIILELFRSQPTTTCALLVKKLTIESISYDSKAWASNQKDSKSSTSGTYTISPTVLAGLGIGLSSLNIKVDSSVTSPPSASKHTRTYTNTTSSAPTPSIPSESFTTAPLDGVSAMAAWSTIAGKKSTKVKYSPSQLMRDSIVSILADLMIEDINAALPHLAIILNYSILKFDTQVALLLYSCLVPIRTLLKDSDKRRSKDLVRTNGVLDTLITLLKHNTFKLDWDCEAVAGTPHSSQKQSSLLMSINSSMLNMNNSTPTIQIPPNSNRSNPNIGINRSASTNITLMSQQQEGSALSLIEWASSIKPGYLVHVFCLCAELLGQSTTKVDWGNELLEWVAQSVSSSPSIQSNAFSASIELLPSTKAIELSRAILEASVLPRDSLDQSPSLIQSQLQEKLKSAAKGKKTLYQLRMEKVDDDDSDEDEELSPRSKYASEFLHAPPAVIKNIQGTLLETLLFLERSLRTSQDANWIVSSSLREKQRHQEHLSLLRARAEDLLSLLGQLVSHCDKPAVLVDILFVGIAVLRLSPVGFSSFYEKGLMLVQGVCTEPRFLELEANSQRIRRHLKAAKQWHFPGLILLVLKSWYSQKTERTGSMLLPVIVEMPQTNLIHSSDEFNASRVSKSPAKLSDSIPRWLPSVLVIVGLLPWIHYSITVLNSRKDAEYTLSVSETCEALCLIIDNALIHPDNKQHSPLLRTVLSPLRESISSLARAEANYGGYYGTFGGASKFIHAATKKLILLQNIYPSFFDDISQLLSDTLIEAPLKLNESIIFVSDVIRQSSVPYLHQRPCLSLSSCNDPSDPSEFTYEAMSAIINHMFSMEDDPILTEATFRIGGTPANDAQARSTVLSVLNALYAFPSNWPISFLEYPDLQMESDLRSKYGIEPAASYIFSAENQSKLLPLTRAVQANSKIETLHQGGLKTAIDALQMTMIKSKAASVAAATKTVGKRSRSGTSSIKSAITSSQGSGVISRNKKHVPRQSELGKSISKPNSPKAPPVVTVLPLGATLGTAKIVAPASTRINSPRSPTSDSTSANQSSTQSTNQASKDRTQDSQAMVTSTSGSAISKKNQDSPSVPIYHQIQVHWERSADGKNIVERGSTQPYQRRKSSADEVSSDSELSDIDEDLYNGLNADDFENMKNFLLNEGDESSSSSDDDDDDDDDDLRMEFFKQFNLDGINLNDFSTFSTKDGKEVDEADDSSESEKSEKSEKSDSKSQGKSKAPKISKANMKLGLSPSASTSAVPSKSKSEKSSHERQTSSSSAGAKDKQKRNSSHLEDLGFGDLAGIDSFEADSIEMALIGLQRYEEESNDFDRRLSTTSADDDDDESTHTTDDEDVFKKSRRSKSSRASLSLKSPTEPQSKRIHRKSSPRLPSSDAGYLSDSKLTPNQADSTQFSSEEESESRKRKKSKYLSEGKPENSPASSKTAKPRPFKKSSAASRSNTSSVESSKKKPVKNHNESSDDELSYSGSSSDSEPLSKSRRSASASLASTSTIKSSEAASSTQVHGLSYSSTIPAASSKPADSTHSTPTKAEAPIEPVSSLPKLTLTPNSASPRSSRTHSRSPSATSSTSKATRKEDLNPSSTPPRPVSASLTKEALSPSTSTSTGGSLSKPTATSSDTSTSQTNRKVLSGTRGMSAAGLCSTGMRKIIDDPKETAKFLSWMKHNNLDSEVMVLIVAIKEFQEAPENKQASLSKRIIDKYFKTKHGLSTLPDKLRTDIFTAYQALESKRPPLNFFASVESYCVDHLTKNHYVMFTKSPFCD